MAGKILTLDQVFVDERGNLNTAMPLTTLILKPTRPWVHRYLLPK